MGERDIATRHCYHPKKKGNTCCGINICFKVFVLNLRFFSYKCPSNNSAELTMIELLPNADPNQGTHFFLYDSIKTYRI